MTVPPHPRPLALRGPARGGPVRVLAPQRRTTPFIFASPHSGRAYEDVFLNACLPPLSVLRRSEDAYMDALFADAPRLGAPLICATFPRVFVDPNRARDELDPAMFEPGAAPSSGAAVSARAGAGLGVVPRLAADGRALYAGRMGAAELRRRLEGFYDPYHARLTAEIEAVRSAFGEAFVIDCHSMPAASARGADIVLGDRYGASCSRALVAHAEACFRELGFAVVRNRPYAGGYTTEHYGRPETGVEALQIEINRGLYLNEAEVRPSAGLPPLRRALSEWVTRMLALDRPQRIAAE
jgi:N-formylglutamate amidohydrolase